MAKKRLLIVDIETTGLYPESGHVILSIGAIVENNGVKAKKEPFSEFFAAITPTEAEWRKATAEALAVNGMTYEYLTENGKPINDVRDTFLQWLLEHKVTQRSHVWLGQNPSFDLKFMKAYMGPELRFVNAPLDDPLDIRDLYAIVANRKKVPILRRLDGRSISLALGVEPEPKVHDALEGARVVHRNYNAIVALGLYD